MSDAERLSTAQRACLLRAARKQLEVYNEQLERMISHSDPDAVIEDKMREIQCVQGAIRWLWRDQRPDDG